MPFAIAAIASLAAPLGTFFSILAASAAAPSAWTLLVYSLRLLAVEAPPATPAYDALLTFRVALAEACATATDDRTERYTCMQVARFESNYREDVGRCQKKGAAGEVTTWQIIPRSAAEASRLCVSLVEDARVHLERVRESRAACRHLPKNEQLALYARGSCASAEGKKLSRHRFPYDALVRAVETEKW